MYNGYAKIMSKAKDKAKYGERPQILTAKQMLQRLPIVFAQFKAGSNSKHLLNEIRQTVYSLYRLNKITK